MGQNTRKTAVLKSKQAFYQAVVGTLTVAQERSSEDVLGALEHR